MVEGHGWLFWGEKNDARMPHESYLKILYRQQKIERRRLRRKIRPLGNEKGTRPEITTTTTILFVRRKNRRRCC